MLIVVIMTLGYNLKSKMVVSPVVFLLFRTVLDTCPFMLSINFKTNFGSLEKNCFGVLTGIVFSL